MTDNPTPVVPAALASNTSPVISAAPITPPKVMRWWGLIGIPVVGILGVILLPFVVEPWVLTKLRNGLAANGWELTPESQLSFSLYGARLQGEHLVMRMIQKSADGTQAQVATVDRLHAEVAVWESLTRSDAIISELAIEGMTGNLRRGPDGRIQAIPKEQDKPAGPGIDWSKVDWVSWYQKGMEQWKKRQELQKQQQKQQQEEQKKQEEAQNQGQPAPKPDETQRPPAEPDIEWPKASKIKPLPQAGRHIPRVVVRKLSITGKAIKLPDESPFEVTAFAINGTNVAARQDLGETMTLAGKVTTQGAGDIDLDLLRSADDTGHLKLAAPAVPVAALSHPAIAGDALAKYGATGTANLTIDNAWTGWDLSGGVLAKISGLTLAPTVTNADTARIATAINALKGKPIAWPVTLGGTLFAPKITDSGIEAVMKGSAMDAAKAIVTDKATEKATEELNKQLDKNPQAKEAADKLKDLFKK